MSRPERLALAGALLLLAVHVAGLWLPGLTAGLEYRRAVLGAQPWRLLTGHWVHINWTHALVNAAAWFVVARLFAPELTPLRQLVTVAVASVAISGGLALGWPEVAWYRGFSGVLHALFFAGATAWLAQAALTARQGARRELWLPLTLWAGGAVKVAVEQPLAGASTYAEWLGASTVPQAHLVGAACGVVLGLAFLRAPSAAPAQARQETE